jgi:hypothetical protein
MLRQAGAPILPVILTDQDSLDALADRDNADDGASTAATGAANPLPFSTDLLALAAARVVARQKHEGAEPASVHV